MSCKYPAHTCHTYTLNGLKDKQEMGHNLISIKISRLRFFYTYFSAYNKGHFAIRFAYCKTLKDIVLLLEKVNL